MEMHHTPVSGSQGFSITNWSQTFTCSPELYFSPKNEDELIQVLKQAAECNKKVKVVGCGNSPSDIMCTNDYLISMKNFNKFIEADEINHTVLVESGVTVAALNEHFLPKHNLGLSVHGSYTNISIGGAISTGTHGSGINFGNMATYVLELDLVLASGEKVHCSREVNDQIFKAANCGLGAIGIITKIKLQCEPAFRLEQATYPAELKEVLEHLSVHQSCSDHFRFMYYPHTDHVTVSHASRTKKPKLKIPSISRAINWFWSYVIGFYLLEFFYWISMYSPVKLVPLVNHLFFHLTYRRQTYTINDSYRIFTFECLFKQYVNEWAVPIEKCAVVLYQLKEWIEKKGGGYAHFPIEVRFVKGDDLYISPASGQAVCYMNIIMYRPYGKSVHNESYWNAFEEIVKKEGGRPHWAKAHREKSKDFQKMYPKWKDWCEIRHKLDPSGMFLNAYLERIFEGSYL